DRAFDVARSQGALFWELRIALSFARLRISQDRGSDARLVLGSACGKFTEGFETADLRAANALIAQLSTR
ncbi:hypothetical protein ABTG69_19505, partial [Acinetobacter baumannii]